MTTTFEIPTVTTERLRLRAFRASDLAQMVRRAIAGNQPSDA